MNPTEEQAHIIEQVRNTTSNICVVSLAGTGKTTTIEMMVGAVRQKPVLCLAFNKVVKIEMEKRLPSWCTVKTFNGMGHSIWMSNVSSKVVVDPKKNQNIMKQIFSDLKGDDRDFARSSWNEILDGVRTAKNQGYIPDGLYPQAKRIISRDEFYQHLDERPDPFTAELIDQILHISIQHAYKGQIDYDDQVYMSALFASTFPRFPSVLIDEAQDQSPANHALLRKLCRNWTGFVGDPHQSIYAFRGAVSGGMRKLRNDFAATELPLSTSFRCPEEIVKAVHWHVPQMRWIKNGGLHAEMRNMRADGFADGSAIICRNNAPLLHTAFKLISAGRSISVSGSDIGPRVVRILRKFGEDNLSREHVKVQIDEWLAKKLEKSNNPTATKDMAACLHVFADYGADLGQAIGYAEYIFKQEGALRLTTGHKAKGLEWETVYHLDPWLCRDDEQDRNLKYVITTRSLRDCFEINSRNIKW